MACDFTLQVYPGLSWHIIFTGRYSSELLSCLPNNIDSARIIYVRLSAGGDKNGKSSEKT